MADRISDCPGRPPRLRVEINTPGSFLSVRGFLTERAAQAWIDEQQVVKRLSATGAPPRFLIANSPSARKASGRAMLRQLGSLGATK